MFVCLFFFKPSPELLEIHPPCNLLAEPQSRLSLTKPSFWPQIDLNDIGALFAMRRGSPHTMVRCATPA